MLSYFRRYSFSSKFCQFSFFRRRISSHFFLYILFRLLLLHGEPKVANVWHLFWLFLGFCFKLFFFCLLAGWLFHYYFGFSSLRLIRSSLVRNIIYSANIDSAQGDSSRFCIFKPENLYETVNLSHKTVEKRYLTKWNECE